MEQNNKRAAEHKAREGETSVKRVRFTANTLLHAQANLQRTHKKKRVQGLMKRMFAEVEDVRQLDAIINVSSNLG